MLPAPLKRFLTAPGRRFAVLVVLGMLVVATPMAEVWRRLGLELQASIEAQRSLEPAKLAVQTQLALMSHRPLAAAVLAGRAEKEAERMRSQHGVDVGLAALLTSLEARRLGHALNETDQLRHDWTALLQGIGLRQMRPEASDTAHQLLVEQTFIIADLAAAGGLYGQAGRAFEGAELNLALRVLPRFAVALTRAQAPNGGLAEHGAVHLRAQARRIAAQVAQALATLDAADQAADALVVSALLSLQHDLASLASASASATDRHAAFAAEASSLQAAQALLTHLDRGLVQAQEVLQAERHIVCAALAATLLLGGLAAALAIPRGRRRRWEAVSAAVAAEAASPAQHPPAPTGTARAESEAPTSELLQRLRQRQSVIPLALPPAPPPRG